MKFIGIGGKKAAVISLDTLVIGTGCAGYNAADTLYDLGRTDVAILTEGVKMGTSRNTGSDKQTYYKLSMCSDGADSIYELAENLFAGGSVNGDTALCEAAGSIRSFMKLVNLGVPFPTNRYGEYVGYKTDHDPRQRATSCGPLTSKLMTEKLEASVLKKGIRIYDNMQAVRILTENGRLTGLLALDLNRLSDGDPALTVFLCNQIVMATGGPAIVYDASVYPESQTGMTGMALEAGADGCNLQEWQYGLASTKFRWNVSGTYQQVLPRYIAVDGNGNEREFLPEYFEDPAKALDMVFLKGYQWPFDTQKIAGSSIVDIIVHHEIFHKGNRVFMDFRTDPRGLEQGFDGLADETRHYLDRSGAMVPTPIKRLEIMNPQAIKLYADHGIDLYAEPLEVAVCAQHHNGGIAVDADWQSTLPGLYVAGEAAGTFGIARPGGSALNSTQVGSLRAAEAIAWGKRLPIREDLSETERLAVEKLLSELDELEAPGGESPFALRQRAQKAMSLHAAHVRSEKGMENLAKELLQEQREFFARCTVKSALELPHALKTRDMLLTQLGILSAMGLTGESCRSRGSALALSESGTEVQMDGLTAKEELSSYRYLPGNQSHRADWVKTVLTSAGFGSSFEPVRPLPRTDDWFEKTWGEYEARRNANT